MNGKPSWKVRAPSGTGSGSAFTAQLRAACETCPGGAFRLESSSSWCEDTRSSLTTAGAAGGLGSGQAAANAAGLAATGQLDPTSAGIGGLDLGIALNRWASQQKARADAQRIALENARIERERVVAERREREKQAMLERLRNEMRTTTDEGELSPRTDEDASHELTMRFDGADPSLAPRADTQQIASAEPAPTLAPIQAPQCPAHVEEMKKLGAEIQTKAEKLKSDLDADAMAFLGKEYGGDNALEQIKKDARKMLEIDALYKGARELYEKSYVQFVLCLDTDASILECIAVGLNLEERARAMLDEAAKKAGLLGAKDRAERGAKITQDAMWRSHSMFADAAPRATKILASPCP